MGGRSRGIAKHGSKQDGSERLLDRQSLFISTYEYLSFRPLINLVPQVSIAYLGKAKQETQKKKTFQKGYRPGGV